jgi:hypothetical protein
MSGREAREIKVCDAFAPGTPGVTVTYTPSGG